MDAAADPYAVLLTNWMELLWFDLEPRTLPRWCQLLIDHREKVSAEELDGLVQIVLFKANQIKQLTIISLGGV